MKYIHQLILASVVVVAALQAYKFHALQGLVAVGAGTKATASLNTIAAKNDLVIVQLNGVYRATYHLN
ncbi:hypothetical protein [Aeromonas veronii]|uniref:hypothetical protein n=1 Tax=Aeromonas veronii TaxID=654 RepID=UPI003D1FC7DE